LFTNQSEETQVSIIKDIEQKLEVIKDKYSELFVPDTEERDSTITELENKITEIQQYHKLLIGEGDTIEQSIEACKNRIQEFYDYLFLEGQANEKKIKDFVDEVTGEDGYQNKITNAYNEIIENHEDLFNKDSSNNSKVDLLKKNIETIQLFQQEVTDTIKPDLIDIQNDIKAKQKDVSALLSSATGGSLVQGFLDSKREYQLEPKYNELEDKLSWKNFRNSLYNLVLFIYYLLLKSWDYVLFILPLIASVIIFVFPDLVGSIIDFKIDGWASIYGRLIVSLPLWWISWFGQRSISHKRRLAEEYNHKAQVATIYLKFTSDETKNSYPLNEEAKQKLHDALITVIKRHPGKIYGKDETILDKIIYLINPNYMKQKMDFKEKSEELEE
jgi:polyhydroxyalkanoate synthesis regulator phasin